MNTVMTAGLHSWVAVASVVAAVRGRLADERGEGVISTAIAVLIIALIGGLMWVAFQDLFGTVYEKATKAVEDIS